MRTRIPDAKISNRDEVTKALDASGNRDGETVEIKLEALGDKTFWMSLIPR